MNLSPENVTDIFERITDAFVALDNNWCYTYMNKKAGVIFNRNPATMIGKHIWTEFPEGIDQSFYKAYYRAMEEQRYIHVEEYFPPWDRWFENHIYPSPEGLSIFFRDITEKKKSGESLYQKNLFIESIINASPDIIYIYDIEERKNVFVNEGIQTNLGYTDTEIQLMGDQVIPILMHPEDFDYYLHNTYLLYGALKEKEVITHKYRMKDKKGNWHWLACKESIFLRNPDGTPKQIFGITTDITDRKRAEEDIEKYNERFEIIASTTNDALWEWNFETGELWANPMHQHLYGLTPADPVPDEKQWEQKIHPDDRDKIIADQKKALASDKNLWTSEYRFETKNGFINIYDRCYIIRNASGKPIRITGTMMDITERKKAENTIEKEKELSDSVINSLPGIFYMADLTPKLLRWNKAMESFSGYSAEELGKMIPITLFDPGDHVALRRSMEKTYKEGFGDAEVQLLTKSGRKIPFYFTGVSVKHEGEPVILGIGIDITERKKAEEELDKSEKLYRNLFENLLHGFAYCKVIINQGRVQDIAYLSVNREYERIMGLKNITGKKISEVFPGALESNPEYVEILNDIAIPGKTVKYETYLKPISKWLSIVLYNTGEEYFVSLIDDITERKKAEKALHESENYLRTILDTEPECVKVLNSNGELLSMNPAGLAMIEADNEQQVLGHRMTELVDEKYRAGFNQLSKDIFKGRSGTFEFEITGLKGGHRWLETHAVPLKDSEGNTTSILGVTRDITERKRTEEEIINTTSQLRQLTTHLQNIREEERKRIGREIHDELGQQLTAMKMDVAWIDKKTPDEADLIKSKLRNIITLLDGSNQSVRKILNELRPGILDDHGLLDAIEWQNRQFTDSTGITVMFTSNKTDIKLPQQLATVIFRVYQESLTNIMRYAEAGKVLSSVNIDDGNIILTIEDDGKGFDMEYVQNKTTFGILGMRERVFSLNGTFHLLSSRGKGTKISVSLPYNTEKLT